MDLGTGQALLTFTPALDPAHGTQAPIGAAGGTLQITDATGAIISLKVPAGALRQTVTISMTPLATSPEVIGAGAVTPGVQFQPEGLHFLVPATLTYDFHTITTPLPTAPRVFLLTSPMTMVPLYGSVDLVKRTMTALLFHFSSDQPATGSTAASDITIWVNALLAASGGTLTLEEMASLLAAEDTQQQLGCTTGCIDTGAVAQAISTAVTAQVAASCPADIANPSLPALQTYLQMDTFLQQVGGSVPALRACEHNVLEALIAQASTDPGAPLADLTDYISGNPTLRYLAKLLGLAQQLGFGDLDTEALQKLDTVFRTAGQDLVTAIQGRQSDANIQAETQQAVSDLTQEQQTGDAEGLASVDPGFDAFIQQEIASLSNKVTFKATSIGGQLCNGILAFGGGITFNPPVSLPVSASGSGCGGQLTLSAKQIGSNEVEFDASGQEGTIPITPTGPTASLFAGTVYLTMQLSSPATVQLDMNTQWATNAPVLTLGGTSFDLGGQIVVIGGSASDAIQYRFGLQTFTYSSPNPTNLPAGTYTVFANVYSGNQLASAGSGWLARITVQ
ncbi:MAG TPA: hypothetical protein VKT49_17155 [Bryobacteraceae bacterium]|nr:hypothetical protein [Bryobacteraceae bacterium]